MIVRLSTTGLVGLLVAILLPLSGPLAARATDTGLRSFAGEYHHAGSSAQARREIDRAIAEVTDDMGFLKRGVAEDRLEEGTSHVPRIRIRIDGNDVRIRLHEVEYRARVNGPAQKATTAQGEEVRVRHRYRDGRLVQIIATGKGHRKNVFSLEDGSRVLRMEVVITSPHLPEDVRYALRYRRR